METKDEYSEYLIEENRIQTRKTGSILSFCCCGSEKDIDKTYYINKWRKNLV